MLEVPKEQYQRGAWGPRINANDFEIKTGLIQMVQSEQFGGRPNEDPNAHLSTFLELCDTVEHNGVPQDAIRMRLFTFSLRDRAKEWFKSLDKMEITTWEELCKAFLAKYFPPSRAQRLIAEISHFSQLGDETICGAWERYRDLLRKCPQHGFSEAQQVMIFYSGLSPHTKRIVDVTSGGCLVNRNVKEALRIIEEMATNSYQWQMERGSTKKMNSVLEDARYDELASQFSLLKKQLEEERRSKRDVQVVQARESGRYNVNEEVCYMNQGLYANFYKQGYQPPQVGFYQGENSYVQQGGYQAYNPNLSYGNPTNAQLPSPGFSVSQGVIEEPKKNSPSMDQMMQQMLALQAQMSSQQDSFINQTGQKIGALESAVSSLAKQVEMMEGQISQMANLAATQHTSDKISINVEVNPRELGNAITLRSGMEYENYVSLGKGKEKVLVEGIPYEESSTHEEEGLEEVQQEIAQKKVFIESPLPTKDMIIKAPFPHHLDEPSYEECKWIKILPTSMGKDTMEQLQLVPEPLCSYPDLGDAYDEMHYPSIFKPGYKYYCFDVP